MNRKLLREICDGCDPGRYCTLKEILLHDAKYSDRLVLQMKAVEKWKYEESVRQRREVDWQEAWELWVTVGLANRFAEVYTEGMTFHDLYDKLISSSR
jgi:hypothetical protein